MIGKSLAMIVPSLFVVLYLGLIVYFIVLATRLVGAVERIARALDGGTSRERSDRVMQTED